MRAVGVIKFDSKFVYKPGEKALERILNKKFIDVFGEYDYESIDDLYCIVINDDIQSNLDDILTALNDIKADVVNVCSVDVTIHVSDDERVIYNKSYNRGVKNLSIKRIDEFGEKIDIQAMFKSNFFSISELADKIEVSRPTIYRVIEEPIHRLELSTIDKICKAFNIGLRDVL